GLGVFPAEAAFVLGLFPAAFHVGFDLVPLSAGVRAGGGVAVAVGRGVVLIPVVVAAGVVGPTAVLVTPVGVFVGGVDGLGDALAREPARHRADDRPDRPADDRAHPGHNRSDGRASRPGGGGADAGANRVRAGR